MRRLSEEHKRKISEAGRGKHPSEETRAKLRAAAAGRIITPEQKKKISDANKGRKLSEETRIKMSESRKGARHPNWQGGLTPENHRIRKSREYKLWREAVFIRDNHTCRFCGRRGGDLHADHIKPFAQYPELRFAIDNGRTLCIPCHRKTPTYGGRTT